MALDAITREAGKGLSDFINKLIYKAGDAVGGAIDKISDVTGGLVAGVSAAVKDVGNIASHFSLGGGTIEKPEPEQGRKLGGNAIKQEMMASMEQDHSPQAANFNTICAPIVPTKVAQSQGAGIGT